MIPPPTEKQRRIRELLKELSSLCPGERFAHNSDEANVINLVLRPALEPDPAPRRFNLKYYFFKADAEGMEEAIDEANNGKPELFFERIYERYAGDGSIPIMDQKDFASKPLVQAVTEILREHLLGKEGTVAESGCDLVVFVPRSPHPNTVPVAFSTYELDEIKKRLGTK
tara:strand:- start:745 stop:1254 length:510 start_codon:yes stop_codon:yes gene_type:complete